jgi:hypothetical protein
LFYLVFTTENLKVVVELNLSPGSRTVEGKLSVFGEFGKN